MTFYYVRVTFCTPASWSAIIPGVFYQSPVLASLHLHLSTPLCPSCPSRSMPPPPPQPPKERGPPSGPSLRGPTANKPSSSSSGTEPSRSYLHRTSGASTLPRRQEGRPSSTNVSSGVHTIRERGCRSRSGNMPKTRAELRAEPDSKEGACPRSISLSPNYFDLLGEAGE